MPDISDPTKLCVDKEDLWTNSELLNSLVKLDGQTGSKSTLKSKNKAAKWVAILYESVGDGR